MNKYELAAQIGLFLITKGQPSYGYWAGRLTAAEQRKWFGFYIGKGKLHVDGLNEKIEMHVRVCFGTDSTTVASINAKIPSDSYVNDTRIEAHNAIKSL